MAQAGLPLLQAYQPATFLERGVAVPFTTPALAGTRARPREGRAGKSAGLELLIPNPSGAPGVYIVPWEGLREFCRPTLHDARLGAVLGDSGAISPGAIRRAALAVAAEGLAGREARAAARDVTAREDEARLLTNYLLLLALVRQNEAPLPGIPLAEQEAPALLERRAKRLIGRIAVEFGCGAERIATDLEELAAMFMPLGIGPGIAQARLGRIAAMLEETRVAAAAWREAHGDASHGHAGLLADAAAATLQVAGTLLDRARGLSTDMLALLRAWQRDRAGVAETCARPDWLLDGWDQICLLWRAAGDEAERRAALAEIVLLVPLLPREAARWSGHEVDSEMVTRHRRMVRLHEDWRTGTMLPRLIARNERIRAMAA